MSEQMSLNRAFDNIRGENLHAEDERPMTQQEDQRGQEEWDEFLRSRPTREEAEYHPVDGHFVEPGEHFNAKRDDHYDRTHDNPAEWPLDELFGEYLDAEMDGDRTFVNDYAEALADKLDAKDVKPSELAKLAAEAQFENEAEDGGADEAARLVAAAIDRRVTEFHNKNIDRSGAAYDVHDKNGNVRTIKPLEEAAIRTDNFRARLERLTEKRLAELRQQNAERTGYEPDWVRVDDEDADDEFLTPETELLPEYEDEELGDEHEAADEDEFFDDEPQTEEQPVAGESTRFAKFKQGVRRHLRESPMKDAPPKPEGYEHPLDKFDRLYTFPFKAKVNGKAAELFGSVKQAAERGTKQPATAPEAAKSTETNRRAKYIGQVLLRNAAILYDEIRESFERSQEESNKKATT